MDKIWNKIEKTDTCWNWKGDTWSGYGKIRIKSKNYRVHRLVYELLVGQIPTGLELDHRCRNRKCVNPEHLEPVTHAVNMERGMPFRKQRTHCNQGHELTEDNIVRKKYKNHGTVCRICKNKTQIDYMNRKKKTPSLRK